MHEHGHYLLDKVRSGILLNADEIYLLAAEAAPSELMACAEALTLEGHGRRIGYSRKVFIPLTRLCRNHCGYCIFATSPKKVPSPYLSPEQVLEIARAGARAGCREALFTLGERPELRYPQAREALDAMGYADTFAYVAAMAQLVFEETGLLPHINPGTMTREEMAPLRTVSASLGIMLESTAEHLHQRGAAHWRCPDKLPQARLDTLRHAGELSVAITSGILIGIGETREERIDALLALRELHQQYGHLQEIIVQNLRAKPGTLMADAPEPDIADHAWTIAITRLIFGPGMSIQAPPNLRPGELGQLIGAGINDWGGISPVTQDHVNPEAAWPELDALAADTARVGRQLVQRLPLIPAYLRDLDRWVDPAMATAIRHAADARGFARTDGWFAGRGDTPEPEALRYLSRRAEHVSASIEITRILERACAGDPLNEAEIVQLFQVEGADLQAVIQAADALRRSTAGDTLTYVRNCNINYTNICQYRCGFCAFAKGSSAAHLRGPAYQLDADAVALRAEEAWLRGATEVCMQGGIHPHYDGNTYLELVAAVKQAVPDMHVHAFSPLEVLHGAETLGLSLTQYLTRLHQAGLRSLPGTAAEILDDDVRAIICPDKLNTEQWLEVMRAAHQVGIRSTATLMFGHVEEPKHWARHLLRVRELQAETGGFTEFVPLPFVHMESPIWHRGQARSGPTLREAVLMHAVSRLALHPLIPNIQTSWVKMGREGAALCLQAGANDLGGTLMYESITRAAGGSNGQLLDDPELQAIAAKVGRPLLRRNTLYQTSTDDRTGSAVVANLISLRELIPPLPSAQLQTELAPSNNNMR
ncbi:5-amino-6-(D-ribitylamino)uracil--L-tyrosine 4-hydroxyphenyl transferase CofH [Pseudomonas saliphila]|uniref:5-amino-6-(D-ribitylamino)uracil--L-tyrosine 4-hydroxyphenyl transferase CofH n=1 Tax=Pseudomonas saliphila TaxID=2586906 RepID=UPI0012386AAF|nr:5-amino-6-(D-ribitylamino)uracil--L-tyrosine 4-hydroxyphenyl transferase CofH [Pseudomonas saliphila]